MRFLNKNAVVTISLVGVVVLMILQSSTFFKHESLNFYLTLLIITIVFIISIVYNLIEIKKGNTIKERNKALYKLIILFLLYAIVIVFIVCNRFNLCLFY